MTVPILGRTRGRYVPVLVLVFLMGCSASTPERYCTLIGGGSTVTVDLGTVMRTVSGPATAKICLETDCRTFPSPTGHRWTVFTSRNRQVWEGSSGTVTVTVRDNGSGRVLFDASAVTPVRSFLPNGQGCPGEVWQASVTATRAGRLTA